MLRLLIVALLSSSPSMRANFVRATSNSKNEIFNPLINFKQCSQGDKEWCICRGIWSPRFYCTPALEFNELDIEDICFAYPNASNFLRMQNISKGAAYFDDDDANGCDHDINCKSINEKIALV